MTFTLHVEHETVDGETILEEFEGVESFSDPPMTSTLHVNFAAEDREAEKLGYGHVVRATDDN